MLKIYKILLHNKYYLLHLPIMKSNIMITNDYIQFRIIWDAKNTVETLHVIIEFLFITMMTFIKNITWKQNSTIKKAIFIQCTLLVNLIILNNKKSISEKLMLQCLIYKLSQQFQVCKKQFNWINLHTTFNLANICFIKSNTNIKTNV